MVHYRKRKQEYRQNFGALFPIINYLEGGSLYILTLWRRNFLLNFSTPVFKM